MCEGEKGYPTVSAVLVEFIGWGDVFLLFSLYWLLCDSPPSLLRSLRSSLPNLSLEEFHNTAFLKTDSKCTSISRHTCHSQKMNCKFKRLKQSFQTLTLGSGQRCQNNWNMCYISMIFQALGKYLNTIIHKNPPFKLCYWIPFWVRYWGWSAWRTSPILYHCQTR